MELIGPWLTGEEIRKVYNDTYQLQRLPSKSPCDVEMEERVCQEILNSVKEHLQCRWECAQPEERLRQSSAGTSWPDPQDKFQDRVHTIYNHFRDLKEGSCEEALTIV